MARPQDREVEEVHDPKWRLHHLPIGMYLQNSHAGRWDEQLRLIMDLRRPTATILHGKMEQWPQIHDREAPLHLNRPALHNLRQYQI